MRPNRWSLALCLAVPALFAAGCGGGGGNSDESSIKDIINEVANDPLAICDHLSDATLQKVFKGDADDCRKAGKQANADEDKGDVDIKSVKITGDNATAVIIDKDKKQQTLKFAKDGDDWVAVVE
jgi:hypothetical protein